jgi:hypothetical protein
MLVLLLLGRGHGVQVTPAQRTAEGSIQYLQERTHFGLLSGIHADSPARSKLMYAVAAFVAYYSCPFCRLPGTVCNTVMRFLGYAAAVTLVIPQHQDHQQQQQQQPAPSATMKPEDDAVRMHSSMRQHLIAAAVAVTNLAREKGLLPAESGPPTSAHRGYSPLLRLLLYTDYNTLWVLPFCHAFYLGVLKDFFKAVTTTEARADEVRHSTVSSACP